MPVMPASLLYRLKKSWTVTRAAVIVSRVISSLSLAWIAWCRPSCHWRPGIIRPVNSSTMMTSPSTTT